MVSGRQGWFTLVESPISRREFGRREFGHGARGLDVGADARNALKMVSVWRRS